MRSYYSVLFLFLGNLSLFCYIQLVHGESESTWVCDNGNTTIPTNATCNGYHDCMDKTDESVMACGACNYSLVNYQYQCNNGICILASEVCDGQNNCGDGSDENDCTYCSAGFHCKNGRCIDENKKCDGVNDCGDFSDEHLNLCYNTCFNNPFLPLCKNGKCYTENKSCDGRNDCGDFTDEKYCKRCRENQFKCRYRGKCIPKSWVCDGYSDCVTDELHCSCLPGQFRCGSGECISNTSLCDTLLDCKDLSDEIGCSYRYGINHHHEKIRRLLPYTVNATGITENIEASSTAKTKSTRSIKITTKSPTEKGNTEAGTTNTNTKYTTTAKIGNKSIRNSTSRVQATSTTKEHTKSTIQTKTSIMKGTTKTRNTYSKVQKSTIAAKTTKSNSKHVSRGPDVTTETVQSTSKKAPTYACPPGMYGYLCQYNCHCKGVCHPGSGLCTGGCQDGWRGPTCQIVDIQLLSAVQLFGDSEVNASASIDGDLSTCPEPATSFNHTYWTAELSSPMAVKRMRIVNKKDTSFLRPVAAWSIQQGCKHNLEFEIDGLLDIWCPNASISDNITIEYSQPAADFLKEFQICELKLIVCSDQSFGVQCERTCNCKDNVPCDDISGECPDGCQNGWSNDTCDTPIICDWQYEFQCNDGKSCIPNAFKCDHHQDCFDNSDESPEICNSTCYDENRFQCGNRKCVPRRGLCDGFDDCGDWTDESHLICTGVAQCKSLEFKCNNGKCIPISYKCNSQDDCGDNSDERYCIDPCLFKFRCTNGKCIAPTWTCDGQDDCGDNSDELSCPSPTCTLFQFKCDNGKCISGSYKCDGMDDCGDNSDENLCGNSDSGITVSSYSYGGYYGAGLGGGGFMLFCIIMVFRIRYYRTAATTARTTRCRRAANVTTVTNESSTITPSSTGFVSITQGVSNPTFATGPPSYEEASAQPPAYSEVTKTEYWNLNERPK